MLSHWIVAIILGRYMFWDINTNQVSLPILYSASLMKSLGSCIMELNIKCKNKVIIHSSLLDGVNELNMSSHHAVTQFHPRFYILDAKPVKLLCSLWQFIAPCHTQIEWHCLSSASQVVSIRARCWVWRGHGSGCGRTQAAASPCALSFLLYLQLPSSLNAFPKCLQTSWTPYFMKHRTFLALCFLCVFTPSQSLK